MTAVLRGYKRPRKLRFLPASRLPEARPNFPEPPVFPSAELTRAPQTWILFRGRTNAPLWPRSLLAFLFAFETAGCGGKSGIFISMPLRLFLFFPFCFLAEYIWRFYSRLPGASSGYSCRSRKHVALFTRMTTPPRHYVTRRQRSLVGAIASVSGLLCHWKCPRRPCQGSSAWIPCPSPWRELWIDSCVWRAVLGSGLSPCWSSKASA